MTYVRQYAKDKVEALDEILALARVSIHECAYIGDDLADIPVMRRVELAVAVADAVAETKQAAHFIRFSTASSMAHLQEAVARLRAILL